MTSDPAALAYDVVVPTVGRRSLEQLLSGLAREHPAELRRVVLVDDRKDATEPLAVPATAAGLPVQVARGRGVGPAAARNAGWRTTSSPWVVFLDDDVELPSGWAKALRDDLVASPPDVGGVQGRIDVPLPSDRPPTDWERNVAGLADAWWATADMAYRRAALEAADGFDERFRRAYREDADLALRVMDAGWNLRRGTRVVVHSVRHAPWWISIAKQRGNADDLLMRRRHGRGWQQRAGAPLGTRRAHFLTTVAMIVAVTGAVRRRRGLLALGLTAWLGATARFAWQRMKPGPRTSGEVTAMLVTSSAIPPVAVASWCGGAVRAGVRSPNRPRRRIEAVLFDRDGTLVVDVPYNADPDRVLPMPGARRSLDRLRDAGVQLAVVTNQSGVARGLLTSDDVSRVNARVSELLGPFDAFLVCAHGPDDGCACRKPEPGLVEAAARLLDVDASRCVVIGDIGADMEAASRAGALGVLVPTPATLPHEVAQARLVRSHLAAAVDVVLAARSGVS